MQILLIGIVSLILSFFASSSFTSFSHISPPTGKTNNKVLVSSTPSHVGSNVLGATTDNGTDSVTFNIDAIFNNPTSFTGTTSFSGSSDFTGAVNIHNGLTVNGIISAQNILYGLKAGSGIGVTDGQTPTISNTGVLTVNGQSGAVTVSATGGDGISVDGLKITNSDKGSTQSIFKTIGVLNGAIGTASGTLTSFSATGNTDTLTFSAGAGVELTSDTSGKKITITTNDPGVAAGWTHASGNVFLTTSSDIVTVDSLNTGYITVANEKSILPSVDLGSDLGSSSHRFNNIYVANINTNSTLSTGGQAKFTYSPTDNTYTESSVIINPTSPATGGYLLGLGVAGYQRAGVDNNGNLSLGYSGNISIPTTTNPLMVYGHNGTNVANIDATGNAYFGGNVGVGTTNPGSPLTIKGTSANQALISLLNPDGTVGFQMSAGGTSNLFMGYGYGSINGGSTTTGQYNTAVGNMNQIFNSTGNDNTSLGAFTMANVTGSNNTAIGSFAGANQSGGTDNTFIGMHTGIGMSSYSTSYNTIIGSQAIATGIAGNGNVALGYKAGGSPFYFASSNILIGYQAGDTIQSGSNNILLGYDIETPTSSTSNFLNIGNLIFGTGINGTGTNISTGNIGIGTTNPLNKLHVNGSVRIDGGSEATPALLFNGTNSGIYGGSTGIYYDFGGTWRWNVSDTVMSARAGGQVKYDGNGNDITNPIFTHSADTNTGLAFGGNDILTLVTGGAQRLYINASGNVGIGTTNPTEKLTLATGNLNMINGNIFLQAATSGIFFTSPGTFSDGIFKDNSASMIFRTNNNTNLAITSGGNIGIGTTNPITKLEVDGNISVESGYLYGNLRQASTSSSYIELYNGGDASMNFVTRNNNIGGFSFSTFNGTQSKKMVITPTGNVGIGTTSPLNKLEIGNAAGFSGNSFAVGNGSQSFALNPSTTGVDLQSSANMTFNTNYVERMRILSTGNTGIGNTAPLALLHVGASGVDSGGISTITRLAGLGNGSVVNPLTLWNTGNGTAGSGASINFSMGYGYGATAEIKGVVESGAMPKTALVFSNYTGAGVTEKMRIDSNGNIGIGTTNPGYMLTVNGSFSIPGDMSHIIGGQSTYFYSSGAGFNGRWDWPAAFAPGYLAFQPSGNQAIFFRRESNTSSDPLFIRAGNATTYTNLMTIGYNGSVGIGTTNPLATLHVAGANGGNAAAIINQLNGGDIFTASASGAPKFTIANNGNVLIGTTTGLGTYNTQDKLTLASGGVVMSSSQKIHWADVSGFESGSIRSTNYNIILTPGSIDLMTLTTSSVSIGASTSITSGNLSLNNGIITQTGAGNNSFAGNVGVGTTAPGSSLEVAATLGAEQAPALTNGNWTVGAGWESPIVGPGLIKNADGGGTQYPSAASTIVAGTTYKVAITVSSLTAGTVNYALGDVYGNTISSAGTYTSYMQANSTQNITIYPSNTSRFTISSVSVKPQSGGTTTLYGNLSLASPIYDMNGKTILNSMTYAGTSHVGIAGYSPQPGYSLATTSIYASSMTGGSVAAIGGAGLSSNNFNAYSGTDIAFNNTGKTTFASNVGIGTTNPTNALEVMGNIYANGGSFIAYRGGGTKGIQWAGTGKYIDATYYNTTYGLSLDGAVQITSGNVGIGTTVPTALLDINGWALARSGIYFYSSGNQSRVYENSGMHVSGMAGTTAGLYLEENTVPYGRLAGGKMNFGYNVLAGLAPYNQATLSNALTNSSSLMSWGGAIESVGTNTLGSETFSNGTLTSGTGWSTSGDITLVSDAASYTHSSGTGTLTQTNAVMATPPKANRWYQLTYSITGSPANISASIGTGFASTTSPLDLQSGSRSIVFKTNSAPGDFVITFTSTGSVSIVFDNFSLKELQGGDVIANGLFTGGGTSGIKVLSNGNVGIGTTNPGTILDLESTNPELTLKGSGSSGFNNIKIWNNYGSHFLVMGMAGTTAPGYWTGDVAGDHGYIGVNTNHPLTFGTSNIVRAIINTSGNFGIGTTNPGYKLQVGDAGDGSEARANAWNSLSDLRFKDNVATISGALNKVLSLNGVSFNWKSTGKASLGLIAQDVLKVFPELVSTDDQGILSLNYAGLSAPLIQAIKEQQDQIQLTNDKLQMTNDQLSSNDQTITNLTLQTLAVSGGVTFKSTVEFQGPAAFKALAEFFDNVVFHKDVAFLGKATFNKNAGGRATIASDSAKVDVTFDTPYTTPPIVTISLVINNTADKTFLTDGSTAFVTNVTEKGFSVMLPAMAMRDYTYNWIALAVDSPTEVKSTSPLQGILEQVAGIATNSAAIAPPPELSPTPVATISAGM